MCGLIGSASSNVYFSEICGLSSLKHRGPDDSGIKKIRLKDKILWLGHTRLAIIDLSKAGRQPMTTPDNRFTIVFNGEIYNYIEIRKELINSNVKFFTNTDTEVLLKAWASFGPSVLSRLIGMFAFVIYDNINKTITLVRDAFGIKPLFYLKNNKMFSFASELNALLQISQEDVSQNMEKCYKYLIFGEYDNDQETFIKNVYSLEPGHFLEYNLKQDKTTKKCKWWNPCTEEKRNISYKDAADEVRKLFFESVQMHLRSDVPLGITLSGGIDSSAIACVAKVLQPDTPIHTFSYICQSKKKNEERYVDIINKHINGVPHKVSFSKNELEKEFVKIVTTQQEPFGGPSIYAQYKIFEKAKQEGIKVLLEGQGADELFAGYDGYPQTRFFSLLFSKKYCQAGKFLYQWRNSPDRRFLEFCKSFCLEYLSHKTISVLSALHNRPLYDAINHDFLKKNQINLYPSKKQKTGNKKRSLAEKLKTEMMQDRLPGLLRHSDRSSMSFSIESRVPFCNIRLAELVLQLPESYLLSNRGITKSIFRTAMKSVVPESVLSRTDKIGFETEKFDFQNYLFPLTRTCCPSESILDIKNLINSIKNKNCLYLTEGAKWRICNYIFWLNGVCEKNSNYKFIGH